MIRYTVHLEGAGELRRSMKRAGIDLKKLTKINREAAQVVAPAAAAAAPKGKTGRLSASVRAGATTRAGVVRAGRKSVPYAGPIHWGWPERNIKGRQFITDTAAKMESQWIKIYEQHVEDILDEIKGA